MNRRIFTIRSFAVLLVVWIALVAAFAGLMIRSSIIRSGENLAAEGASLNRTLSQRVAQHEAHLTSLAALVQAEDPPPVEPIRQVALAIMRFYPRILSIRVLENSATGGVEALAIAPAEAAGKPVPTFSQHVFGQRSGEARFYVEDEAPGRYFLGKRAGAGTRRQAIVIEIDPAGLLENSERLASVGIRMSLGDSVLVERGPVASQPAAALLTTLDYRGVADSQTQPIQIAMEQPVSLMEAIEFGPLIAFSFVSLLALVAIRYTLAQRSAARHSQELAAIAEKRSRVLERETRLAHAARVNSLGELASGIAHELNQPLTALLSQSQAALRLAGPDGDPARLVQALDANVREARRAGDILGRMRDYIARRSVAHGPADLNTVINDAASLASADLSGRGIRLVLDLDQPIPQAIVDTIELEQVLHNLIRNAAESLEGSGVEDREITIRTFDAGDTVTIRLSDNGRGIPPEVFPRLFEPFFTTKPDGLGLGLSLCATLIERVGGTIEAESDPNLGGASFIISFPAVPFQRLAAQ